MKQIKTLKDIQILKNGNMLSKGYIKHLEVYFRELAESLDDNNNLEEFSLQSYGYIVILEQGDNLRDLSDVGLNPEDGGLLGVSPEFVNVVRVDNRNIYQIGVLYDNEFMMIFYSEAGIHDDEVEEWLSEYAIE